MKKVTIILVALLLIFSFAGCSPKEIVSARPETESTSETQMQQTGDFDKSTCITDVINNPSFGDYGRLIFPADTGYYSGDTLEKLGLVWYNNISPDKTVEIVNYLKNHANAGETVFYDIYTDEEKAADPSKKDTGFFFKGTPGEKFAVCNAGGGFAYVGAMQDRLPSCVGTVKERI